MAKPVSRITSQSCMMSFIMLPFLLCFLCLGGQFQVSLLATKRHKRRKSMIEEEFKILRSCASCAFSWRKHLAAVLAFEILLHPIPVNPRLSVPHFDPGKHVLRRVGFQDCEGEKV